MVLSAEEKLEIMEKEMRVSWGQIDAFIQDQLGGSPDTRTNYGLIWAENKYDLFKLFGDKLCLTSEVENTLSDSDITRAYEEKVLREIKGSLSVRTNLVAAFFLNQFSREELRLNRIAANTEFSGKKISKGMKVTKALKLFIPDKVELDIVQTAFSRFIQELEAKGRLDVSIDFFDILCMSVNDRKDWRSCHNFINGEYGGGAFSYALDSSSAIAQIYTSYSDSGVADKIWRQMVWFDTDRTGVILSRQYPSTNSNNRKATQSLIMEHLGKELPVAGFVSSGTIEQRTRNIGDYHYNDITKGAMEKVMTIAFDGSNFSEKSGRDAMRNAFINDEYNPSYRIGVDSVPHPVSGYEVEAYEWDEEWY